MKKTPPGGQLEARLRVLEEHLRAENAHDLEAIMETFAGNARLVLNGKTFSELGAIRDLHDTFGFGQLQGFSDLRVAEKQRYVTSDAIIMEQTLSGEHTRTWNGIPASGRRFEVSVCTVYTFDPSGKIVGENVYFDNSYLLRQLGANAPR